MLLLLVLGKTPNDLSMAWQHCFLLQEMLKLFLKTWVGPKVESSNPA